MTSPSIHKDLVNCCAVEMTRSMINEMGDSLFSILVDESHDNSIKEQMAVVLRFVEKSGQVKERLLGISHIADTCAQSLKDVIDAIFSTHGLSISSLRSQGYDGASNMSASVDSCFLAHRNVMLSDLFNILAIIVNLVGVSCKRIDALRTSYYSEILKRLNIKELSGGIGQFQEMSLACPGETRWGSHLKTITRFITMFNVIIDVLENISEDGINLEQKSMAVRQIDTMQEFQFVFSLHFIFEILAITDYLSQALQKKESGYSECYEVIEVVHISMPNMNDIVVLKDSISQELNDRFLETTTELFTSISCLSPRDLFAAFDVYKFV
ncbi:uncharacterized protein LOC111411202 [Olea europaea var. sylvestris]|uniref:uncharacterized protein LOC111411202 n=1 Tax=Olea europaea var. sylvestris TaxID=158386 RepID=UPI000C1CE7B4|nr:uncharacterized protein LOC111411202 [Olea europaea var. sylvestris]